MKKILVLLMFLHNLSSLLAQCPETPPLASPYDCNSPKQITPTDLLNYPQSSFYDISLSFEAKIVDNSCSAAKDNYISLATQSSKIFNIYSTSGLLVMAPVGASGATVLSLNDNDWVSIFISAQVSASGTVLKIDAATSKSVGTKQVNSTVSGLAYDASTMIYLCSDTTGTAPTDVVSCEISKLTIYYSTPSGSVEGFSVSSATPTLKAFYPLVDGPAITLWDTVGQTSSGYLGDPAQSAPWPRSFGYPTWDSSNRFINITSMGQFLTLPMPDYATGDSLTSFSFTVSAWIKVKSGFNTQSTIFSIHDDIKPHKAALYVKKTGELVVTAFSIDYSPDSSLHIIFDTWHLVGLTAFVTASGSPQMITLSVSVDTSTGGFSTVYHSDFANGDVLNIGEPSGNSVFGGVSVVRIMSPGSAIIRGSDMCSTTDSLEVGTGSFALQCTGTKGIYDGDNKCYDITSCPSGSTGVTGAAQNLCLSSVPPSYVPANTGGNTGATNGGTAGNPETIKSSSGGLAGGAIVGIAIGSIAGIALVGGGALYLARRRKRSSRKSPYIPEATTVITASP